MADPFSVALADIPSQRDPQVGIWDSLKGAIAQSSGFRSWHAEQPASVTNDLSVEKLMRLYLLETLETLAY